MLQTRVIPSLLLKNGGLVKTVRFKNPTYIGDPINAIRIFNDKEVDELTVIDIDASREKRDPDFKLLDRINKEAFMPLAYGGGIRTIDHIVKILGLGYEKVIINSAARNDFRIIEDAAKVCGNQSVVICIDTKKNLFSSSMVYDHILRRNTKETIREFAQKAEKAGAGEIIVNSVDREGTFSGYDLTVLKLISSSVSIPVVALGGAGKLEHFAEAVQSGGVSAVSAGSFFVYHGPHKAVLITYPERKELETILHETSLEKRK
jgi:imidazole glycerol-phosphate synthase subunit HisF